ncbi:MAG: type II toxin-antitoxin system RelE/ParE family toxin [Proteobacteria bacterium]|nr:type II toxin-antitoxin system RelE/ParE family toxin [Pseudomonadota bacterium]
MVWKVEISGGAGKALARLDKQTIQRILRFLDERVAQADDPRAVGQPLKGSRLGDLWRYRVGDYRIIADIQDRVVTVLVLRVGHRREVYREG